MGVAQLTTEPWFFPVFPDEATREGAIAEAKKQRHCIRDSFAGVKWKNPAGEWEQIGWDELPQEPLYERLRSRR